MSARFERATAAYRPLRKDVAVMITHGRDTKSELLSIDAARLLHASLGAALRLADCRDRPLWAVPGAEERD